MRRQMKLRTVLVALSMAPALVLTALPQKAPQQRTLTVVVLNVVEPSHAQPVSPVKVRLTYLYSGLQIVASNAVTNPRGEAFLALGAEVADGGDLRVRVEGAERLKLAIYQPADGQLTGVPAGSLTVKMLPVGSAALLEPEQIQAMLTRLSRQQTKMAALTQQNKVCRLKILDCRRS
jgi:hypothetical protein